MSQTKTQGLQVDVRENRLLAAVRQADMQHLSSHLKPVMLTAGQVLFEPGHEVVRTYFPCRSTMISLLVGTRSGREVEVVTIGREGAVGGIVSSGNKPAFGRALVQIPGAALVVETERLAEAKAASPAFGDLFSRYADSLLAETMQAVACNALHSIEQRCCRWLLATHDRAGAEIIALTQEALAEMLGCQRTSVTAVCQALQEQGLIRYSRGRIELVDRRGLEKAACECYRAVESHFERLLPELTD